MTDIVCGYRGDRDETLVAYLYDDINAIERARFETHLTACERCRGEIEELRAVRVQLARWAPPMPRFAVDSRQSTVESRIPNPESRFSWSAIPVWAQAAAALLVLGVSAGVANLNVRYDRDGLTVRTGWMKPAPEPARDDSRREDRASIATPVSAPWRGDLAALEKQLRSEFRASQLVQGPVMARAAAGGSGSTLRDDEMVRRLRTLIQESERKQQRELALRVADVLRDVTSQRAADLVRIEQSLGLIQNNTGVELLKQRQQLNYLVRTSQRQ